MLILILFERKNCKTCCLSVWMRVAQSSLGSSLKYPPCWFQGVKVSKSKSPLRPRQCRLWTRRTLAFVPLQKRTIHDCCRKQQFYFFGNIIQLVEIDLLVTLEGSSMPSSAACKIEVTRPAQRVVKLTLRNTSSPQPWLSFELLYFRLPARQPSSVPGSCADLCPKLSCNFSSSYSRIVDVLMIFVKKNPTLSW